jgi:c-di-GMP-binding flagellar brake protein YcgR
MEERRMAHRYRIPVAVEVRRRSKETESEFIPVKTRDVSTGGLYLRCNQRIAVGTQIALTLTLSLPNNGIGAVVDCKARVVRVEESLDAMTERFGIAVAIDRYNFVRPKSAPS